MYPMPDSRLLLRVVPPDRVQWAERRWFTSRSQPVVMTLKGADAWQAGAKLLGVTDRRLVPSAKQDEADVRRKVFEILLERRSV
jgi:hypothetical protein